MTEQKNTVVGILKASEMLVCIQALEKLEQEAQTIVDQTPDAQLDDKWEQWQRVAVSARAALGTFRTIMKNAAKINEHPDTSFTIRWEGSLEKALEAMGLPFKSERHEEEQRGEWDERTNESERVTKKHTISERTGRLEGCPFTQWVIEIPELWTPEEIEVLEKTLRAQLQEHFEHLGGHGGFWRLRVSYNHQRFTGRCGSTELEASTAQELADKITQDYAAIRHNW